MFFSNSERKADIALYPINILKDLVTKRNLCLPQDISHTIFGLKMYILWGEIYMELLAGR